ncbi:LuxR C-terminal-related transcriptional regulator [Actinophytocola sp.]|uniref:LuxR C-terminal-related transcriptional regulator n=1 Tax=Actinophytocola sp. TaxID=1872138 RepID=UPI002DDD228F|nr:LuxR C-terminal-related transcriptional regulator [Actinophytocola sp.]
MVLRVVDALLRESLASWVDSLPGYEVEGAVASGAALVRLCGLQSPDVAVVQVGSAEAAAEELALISELRGVRSVPQVVGLHQGLDPRSLLRLYRAGAHRLVSSRFGLSALEAALGGTAEVAGPRGGLSERELEILALITAGCSAADIAQALEISPNTVTSHKRRIFAKLDVRSRTQAAAEVGRLGLLRTRGNGRATRPVRGHSGPLREEVARILAGNRKAARSGVSVLVDPVDSTWRTGSPADDTVVVIGREHGGRAAVADALVHGARAVLTDDQLAERLPAVISLVKAGYLVASEEVVRAMLAGALTAARPPSLTRRERDILASVALGHSVRQTAQALGIAVKTVQSEQRQLFSKLGARNRLDALALAREHGLVDP